MQFENSFEVPLPPAEAWKVLLDVPRIAPCFPGAELTETIGPDKYKGRAGVKIGPVSLYFAGEAEIVAKDEAARKATIKGKGNDTKGRGQANATVDFALRESGSGTRVEVKTDLNMTGMVAQYGRASGLMKEIAGAILSQFAENLRQEIERSPSTTAAAAGEPGRPQSASTAEPEPAAAVAKPRAAPMPAPVSALSILWIALRSWFSRLLGRKPS